MSMANEKDLRMCIARIYELRRGAIQISPSWLATEAMIELDPKRISPPAVSLGCHLHLRQLARGICRQKFESDDEDTAQHQLFPDLQERYPTLRKKGEEPQYVLLEHLSEDDIEFNISRLRSEADAKLRHADALEAWLDNARREKSA